MIKSFNNQIACEPYQGSRGLKSKISAGVAVVQQKTEVIGLKVLADAQINDSISIKKGDKIYIKEETLYNHKEMYSRPLKLESIKEPFVLANFSHVVFVEGK